LARLSVLDRLYPFVEALVYGGVIRCEEDFAMEASAVGFRSVAGFDFRISMFLNSCEGVSHS
jgi:hypothetical protein